MLPARLTTIDLNGNRGQLIDLSSPGGGNNTLRVAINEGANEYCVVYDQRSGGANGAPPGFAVRKVNASNLSLGAETVVPILSTGTDIAYNSTSGKYLVTYNGPGGATGRFLRSCDLNNTSGSDFLIMANVENARVAANKKSNTFGLFGQDQQDLGSTYAVIDSSGTNLTSGIILIPPKYGQYVQNIAPNTNDGTFAGITDRDYIYTVFVANIGLKVGPTTTPPGAGTPNIISISPTSGTAGQTTITINGTNLTTTVQFFDTSGNPYTEIGSLNATNTQTTILIPVGFPSGNATVRIYQNANSVSNTLPLTVN